MTIEAPSQVEVSIDPTLILADNLSAELGVEIAFPDPGRSYLVSGSLGGVREAVRRLGLTERLGPVITLVDGAQVRGSLVLDPTCSVATARIWFVS